MKNISMLLATSLMIVMFIIGLAAGYFISPEYQSKMYTKDTMDLGQADRFVDLRYINAMIAHHRGAILLAQQIQNKSQHEEIKNLVPEILTNEPKAIAELYQWKKDWFKDTRTIRDPIVANLGSSDEKIDLRFLNALISHHQTGIVMTKEVRLKSSRKEILDNADAVETFLSNGVSMLKDLRNQWYGI
jgi:hypothetical protein